MQNWYYASGSEPDAVDTRQEELPLQIGADLQEALASELASYSLFMAMKYEDGALECEQRLIGMLDAIGRRMDAHPSPRSMTELIVACQRLYGVAREHNRTALKLVCADKLLFGDTRWAWVLRCASRAAACSSHTTNASIGIESKSQEDELSAALTRSREAVESLKSEVASLAKQLNAERCRRRAAQRRHASDMAALQSQLKQPVALIQPPYARPCNRLHTDDDLSAYASQREVCSIN
jgi:hypothetical protein